jgi:hypothetical protein
MEPEIARRCKSCGAAIRARSTFCPQCGVALDGDAPASAAVAPAAALESQEQRTTGVRPSAEPLAATIAPNPEAPVQLESTIRPEASVQTQAPAPEDARGRATAADGTPVENRPRVDVLAPSGTPADVPGGKRQSVAMATGRDFADKSVRPRAEKLRRASSVVIDEAAADPSLRFVLVAVGLVIISLLLLVLARIL